MTMQTTSRRSLRLIHRLSIGSTVLVLMLSCLVPLVSRAQSKIHSEGRTKSPYSKKDLLDALRTNARTKELSTKQFVEYIEQRGVDFEMTDQDDLVFRKAGAGAEIIAAIHNNYRQPVGAPRSLTINSIPGECQVFLDGQLRGTTNEAGLLVLRPVKIGSYKVTLRKPNYRDQERRVMVLPSGSAESFFLSPIPGRLNVTVNTDGARITIRNVGDTTRNAGEYSDKVPDLELTPGSYEVEVSKPGYRAFNRKIVLAAGAPFYLPVTLEKMSVDEMVAQAKENYDRHNYSAAMALARAVLTIQPEHPKANDLLGSCLYFQGQSGDAMPYLKKAILNGEPKSIQVLHRHGSNWNGKTLSPGRLTLYREAIEFSSTDYPDQSFRIPYSNISTVSIKDQTRLELKVRVKLPKNRKESQEEYNFYSTDAVATGRLITCSQCSTIMRFALQLLMEFRPGS